MTAKELSDLNRVLLRLNDWAHEGDDRSFTISFDAAGWVGVRLYRGGDIYCAWATPVKRVWEVIDLIGDKEDGVNEAV